MTAEAHHDRPCAGRRRVQKFNERGQEEASFDEFVYDTVKGTVISSRNGVFTQDK